MTMRDYRHNIMSPEHARAIAESVANDRSTPQRAQLWRESTSILHEIVATGRHAINGEPLVAYRRYEPNGEVLFLHLEDFLSGEPGNYRFTREY